MERLGVDPEGREVWFQWSLPSAADGTRVPVVTGFEHGHWVYQLIVPVPQLLGLIGTLKGGSIGVTHRWQ